MRVGVDSKLLARRKIGELQIDVIIDGTRLIGCLICNGHLAVPDLQLVERDLRIRSALALAADGREVPNAGRVVYEFDLWLI